MSEAGNPARMSIETLSQNGLFRRTGWLMSGWGIGLYFGIVMPVGMIYAVWLERQSKGVKASGLQNLVAFAPILLLVGLGLLFLSLPYLSQRAGRRIGANRLSIKQLEAAVRARKVRYPWFAYVTPTGYIICAVIGACAIGAIVYFADDLERLMEGTSYRRKRVWMWLALFVFAMVSAYVLRGFKRRAGQAMAIIGTPPVVLLRSFADDGIGFKRGPLKYLMPFESMIAGQVCAYGPVVAIGRPGEILAPSGAARTYTSDDEWQDQALAFMSAARLIVMMAGDTQGLRWELAQILQRDWTGKLLVLIPPVDAGSATKRLAVLNQSLNGTPWQGALAAANGADVIAVRLEPAGRVVLIKATGYRRQEKFYYPAVYTALHGILCRDEPQVVGVPD